ncbi:MAG TPA: hypothetical protein IAD51_04950 [Candidatus Limadaptatus stercorigallinarum]|uniref:Uncharacterized protein n=1 Tax=Candidatus Limadaptatus stercorigallinarum TaxID=2840845 RepID=A0A9D1L327_9FIRM|nr:hypothetical protein [Candidatus Limadaptatus stercorigallinarum]
MEERRKISSDEIRRIIKAIKETPFEDIILISSAKNRSFMSEYKMEDKRWKSILRSLTEEEYDETLIWDRNPQIELHVFFITRLLANIEGGKWQDVKIYVKLGFDYAKKVLVVSFHNPDFPDDERFKQ